MTRIQRNHRLGFVLLCSPLVSVIMSGGGLLKWWNTHDPVVTVTSGSWKAKKRPGRRNSSVHELGTMGQTERQMLMMSELHLYTKPFIWTDHWDGCPTPTWATRSALHMFSSSWRSWARATESIIFLQPATAAVWSMIPLIISATLSPRSHHPNWHSQGQLSADCLHRLELH